MFHIPIIYPIIHDLRLVGNVPGQGERGFVLLALRVGSQMPGCYGSVMARNYS